MRTDIGIDCIHMLVLYGRGCITFNPTPTHCSGDILVHCCWNPLHMSQKQVHTCWSFTCDLSLYNYYTHCKLHPPSLIMHISSLTSHHIRHIHHCLYLFCLYDILDWLTTMMMRDINACWYVCSPFERPSPCSYVMSSCHTINSQWIGWIDLWLHINQTRTRYDDLLLENCLDCLKILDMCLFIVS